MKANELLINMDILKHYPEKEMINPANEIINRVFNNREQESIRTKLVNDWDDMVAFMIRQVDKYKKP